MPDPVIVTVSLPRVQLLDQLDATWGAVLIEAIQQHGQRLNDSIHKDGGIAMVNPLVLGPFLNASLPTAANWTGGIIYVSDGAAGTKFRGSDGVAWVNLG